MIIEYDNSILTNEIILLFFYASYSKACNANLEILDYLNDKLNISIYKINVTKYPFLKNKYQVKYIPAYVLLKNNKFIGKNEGTQNRYFLCSWIKQYLR